MQVPHINVVCPQNTKGAIFRVGAFTRWHLKA